MPILLLLLVTVLTARPVWAQGAQGAFIEIPGGTVSAGGGGTFYGLGVDGRIYRWDGFGSDWTQITSAPGRDHFEFVSENEIYVLGSDGRIYQWNGSSFEGPLTDSALADYFSYDQASGTFYGLGVDGRIYRWDGVGSGWTQITSVPGRDHFEFVSENEIYVLGSDGRIYQWNGSSFEGPLTDSTLADYFSYDQASGTFYGLGTDGRIYRWDGFGSGWTQITSAPGRDHFEFVSENEIYVLGSDGRIYQWNGSSFEGPLTDSTLATYFSYDQASGDNWIINTTKTSTHIFESDGTPILVNVQSAGMVTVNGVDFEFVQATGIPNYAHTMTQEGIDTLNNRPNAATDFDNGETSAGVGQVVEFGEDIGYQPGPVGCALGYWPRGPECPANVQHAISFPVNPTPASDGECSTGLGTIGLALNGVSIFGWTDGTSYNNQGVWEFLAVKAEQNDLDICGGHATQQGGYHHHGHSQCLAEQLGDEGSDHSPLYGYIADGYPIYGPYVAAGTLAQSCWKTRDYDNTGSLTGCGQASKRTCLLVDQFDITQGTTPAASPGPDTTQTITTQSGNPLVATSGFFFEDYYYDANCASQGIAFLDQHNGHTHDELGYHYHITIQQNANNTFEDVFPSNVGPTFHGELQPNSVATCDTG